MNSKFTFIIPTLWYSNLLIPLIEELENTEMVGEIILIENSFNPIPLKYSKLKRIILSDNIYVNASWNLGIEYSENEYICLCNDDIFFNVKNLLLNITKYIDYAGSIGINPKSFETYVDNFYIDKGDFIGQSWGGLIFLKKTDFKKIPNNLKIWYGDNWIVKTTGDAYSFIYPVTHRHSKTSNRKEFQSIIHQDIVEWKNIKNIEY